MLILMLVFEKTLVLNSFQPSNNTSYLSEILLQPSPSPVLIVPDEDGSPPEVF